MELSTFTGHFNAQGEFLVGPMWTVGVLFCAQSFELGERSEVKRRTMFVASRTKKTGRGHLPPLPPF